MHWNIPGSRNIYLKVMSLQRVLPKKSKLYRIYNNLGDNQLKETMD